MLALAQRRGEAQSVSATLDSIDLVLPMPHSKQRAFLGSKAKRKVIVAGRRGGKTTGSGIAAMKAMLKGKIVLYVAPSAEQTSAFWRFITRYAEPLVKAKVAKLQRGIRRIEAWNGGAIRCKTGWNGDALRGEYCDLLILDEYSLMDAEIWTEVGAPMLLDNDGDAIFIFTPKRKNHAFYMYQKAANNSSGRWGAWHFTSYDNPHISEEALAEILEDTSESAYKQEILAQFLEGEGAVFRYIREAVREPREIEDAEQQYVMGIDFGRTTDYTVVVTIETTSRHICNIDRYTGLDWLLQMDRIVALTERYKPKGVLAEENAMGGPIISSLRRRGVPVLPFTTDRVSKPIIIDNLAMAFENRTLSLPQHQALLSELESFEYKQKPGGMVSYEAPSGMHDDCVIALALAYHAMGRPSAKTLVDFL